MQLNNTTSATNVQTQKFEIQYIIIKITNNYDTVSSQKAYDKYHNVTICYFFALIFLFYLFFIYDFILLYHY